MDPITAAALAALATGTGGEAGRQAWQGLVALVRRPFTRESAREEAGAPAAAAGSGEPELAALAAEPADALRAQALATALGVRAALDADFRRLLDEWWRQARAAEPGGDVHNQVSGGTQHQVVQARDISHLTFTTD
ncbi:hypothetical protein ACFQLX_10440 [Streptomyces polyrhachis]|uniref:Uncharacterized protein n=1 Tax=Streptomyces polyrhachis TaxID=1282885 RepID=A0ABW2GFR1_9ACTN